MALTINEKRELVIQAEPGTNDALIFEAGYNQGAKDSHEGFLHLLEKQGCGVKEMRKYVVNMIQSIVREKLKIDDDVKKSDEG